MHNLCVVHVERGKLLEAQSCLEKAHRLAPEEDYVFKHLQIVQNRIAKFKLNPNEETESNPKGRSKVVSNKSIDDNERKTTPVVTGDSEEQRYSSRVVNTEPLFVKNVDNIDYMDDPSDISFSDNRSDKSLNNKLNNNNNLGTDNDDPSSGMS